MPIIDRWLDQAPERRHLLADALVHRSVRGNQQQWVIADWRRALVELRTAAQQFDGDGIPIAIEGLRTLAAYIEVTADPGDADAESISSRLRELADHNEHYEHTKQELTNFRRWAPTAWKHVNELERLTAARVGDPASQAAEPPDLPVCQAGSRRDTRTVEDANQQLLRSSQEWTDGATRHPPRRQAGRRRCGALG